MMIVRSGCCCAANGPLLISKPTVVTATNMRVLVLIISLYLFLWGQMESVSSGGVAGLVPPGPAMPDSG